ncbi:MAG: hypothetical protein ACYTHN_17565 [Planctomycetota bacterium]
MFRGSPSLADSWKKCIGIGFFNRISGKNVLDKESRFASLPTVILYYLVIGLVLSFFFSIVGIAVSPYITHRAQRDAGKE